MKTNIFQTSYSILSSYIESRSLELDLENNTHKSILNYVLGSICITKMNMKSYRGNGSLAASSTSSSSLNSSWLLFCLKY